QGSAGGGQIVGGGYEIWTRYQEPNNYSLSGSGFGGSLLYSVDKRVGSQAAREAMAMQAYLPGRYTQMRGQAEAQRASAHIKWLSDFSARMSDQSARLAQAQTNYLTSVVAPSISATVPSLAVLEKVVARSGEQIRAEKTRSA